MTNASWKKSLRHSGFAILLAIGLCLPAIVQAQNNFNVIHTFTGGSDGANPVAGLTLDPAGNLYGTTSGIISPYGTVFRLKRVGTNFLFELLHTFTDSPDGAFPEGRV